MGSKARGARAKERVAKDSEAAVAERRYWWMDANEGKGTRSWPSHADKGEGACSWDLFSASSSSGCELV